MRAFLVLAFLALPTAAAAAPSLQCSFDGNQTKVVIVNPDKKEKRCHYVCHYTFKNGWIQISNERLRVKAGETHTQDHTHSNRIESVSESKLQCE